MKKTTSKVIESKLGFTRQQLYYWRKALILFPSARTLGGRGHFLYDFQDIKTLQTIKYLHDSEISTFRIKKCFKSLKKHFPQVHNPFAGKPILVFGQKIVFVYEGDGYDAFSGQLYLLNFKKMEGWGNSLLSFDEKLSSNRPPISLLIAVHE